MQVVVNDLLTNYELAGSGQLLLFLHGWGDNSAGSTVLRQRLAQKYQVLAPDLPGFGKTQAPKTAWTLDDYAEFVQTLLHKLDLGQPYAVLGHSNGGAIAIRAIALDTLQPQKLILLAAAGIRSGNTARKVFLQILAKLGNIATIGLPERYRKSLRKQLYRASGSDMLVVENMQDTFKNTVKQDVQADAAEVTQPTLLIFGKTDTAVPPQMGQRYHDLIKGSELHMLSAGHFVHLDQPQQTAQLIEDFLV